MGGRERGEGFFWEWVNFSWNKKRSFDGKKGRNWIRLVMEPEMFSLRFFLGSGVKTAVSHPKILWDVLAKLWKIPEGRVEGARAEQDFAHGHGSNLSQISWMSRENHWEKGKE